MMAPRLLQIGCSAVFWVLVRGSTCADDDETCEADVMSSLQRAKSTAAMDDERASACAGWCAGHKDPWEKKCGFTACSSCDDCVAASTPTLPASPSKSSSDEVCDASCGTFSSKNAGWKCKKPKCKACRQCKTNVLFILMDDLNANIHHLGHPLAKTPNMDALAAEGVSFKNAHSNHVICAPSRSSLFTGILGQTSGNFFFDKWYRNDVLSNSMTVQHYFRSNGYISIGTGKLMHPENGHPEEHHTEDWDEYQNKYDYGPFAHNGLKAQPHPDLPATLQSDAGYGAIDLNFATLDDIPFQGDACLGQTNYQKSKCGWADGKGFPLKSETIDGVRTWFTPDEKNARFARDRLKELGADFGTKPFFMAVGLVRPHTPLYAEKKFFDEFPLDSIEVPSDEEAGTHFRNVSNPLWNNKGYRYFDGLANGFGRELGLKKFIQAYLASIMNVDAHVGMILEGLQESGLKDSTVVVLTSDHGWQNGAKNYLFKNAPWEEATRIPLILRVPGMAQNLIVEQPVTLVDIYPTLKDVAGLTGPTFNTTGAPLDGYSMKPLIDSDTATDWEGPPGAVSVIYGGEGGDIEVLRSLVNANKWDNEEKVRQQCRSDGRCSHWTVRTARYRYIRYHNGAEELYDHDDDPTESSNLIGTEYDGAKTEHYELLRKASGLDEIR